MKSTTVLSIIYVIFSFFLLISTFNNDFESQFLMKLLMPLLLGSLYVFNVKKERFNKYYLLIVFSLAIGEIAFLFRKDYFIVSTYTFTIAQIILTIVIYHKYLRNRSKFDIFTFSLPFLFTISVIYLLLDLNYFWSIHIFFAGLVTIVTASTVLLNYANTKNVQNYLFFMGAFTLLLLNTLACIYVFHDSEEIYFLLAIILDVIANYMICRAFLLDGVEEEEFLDNY